MPQGDDRATLKKLQDETEFLSKLLAGAYVDYLFLRPVIANKALAERMQSEGKAAGFHRIGETLYWAFIHELIKIWDDRDSQGRHVSIRKILDQAVHYKIVRELEEKRSAWTYPHGELPELDVIEQIRKHEEIKLREDFRVRFDAVIRQGYEVLDSPQLKAYRKVRNKLISHTETSASEAGLRRFDIQSLHLTFGDERKLLATTLEIMRELQCLIQGIDFSWESLRQLYTGDVCLFWGVDCLDENCP